MHFFCNVANFIFRMNHLRKNDIVKIKHTGVTFKLGTLGDPQRSTDTLVTPVTGREPTSGLVNQTVVTAF